MPRFLRLPQVRDITGLSRSSLYETADFPKPVKIGPRAVAWIESEVSAWVEQRIAQREAI